MRMAVVDVDAPPEMADVEVFTDGGPWAMHNMPCSVCQRNKAVLNLNTGILEPCWECQRAGWHLVRRSRSWWRRILFG